MSTTEAKHRTINRELTTPNIRFANFKNIWEEVKFGDLFEFKQTNSLSRDALNHKKGKVKNIHYGDIHTKFRANFDITKEDVPFINENIDISKIKKENYCTEGDLVIADASEDFEDIGKAIEVRNLDKQKTVAGLHTLIARPQSNLFVPGFLSYLIRSKTIRLQIMMLSQGTKVLGISTRHLSEVLFKLPKIAEQQKIADFLNSIDKWSENLRAQNESLRAYKKGMMQTLLTKGIGHSKFKNTEIGRIPEEWEIKNFCECLEKNKLQQYTKIFSYNYLQEGKYPIIDQGKVFICGFTNNENDLYSGELPIIIFGDHTRIFKYVNIPFAVGADGTQIIISDDKIIKIKFFYYVLLNLKIKNQGYQRHYKYLKEFFIPIPNLNEQQKIADFLSSIDKLIELKEQQINQAEEWNKGLMQNLFV